MRDIIDDNYFAKNKSFLYYLHEERKFDIEFFNKLCKHIDSTAILSPENVQMQCCGTPFSIGDTVKWEALKADTVNTPVDIGDIDYLYEAHDDGGGKIMSLTGKVDEIRILYHKYALTNEKMYLIPVSGKLIKTDTNKRK